MHNSSHLCCVMAARRSDDDVPSGANQLERHVGGGAGFPDPGAHALHLLHRQRHPVRLSRVARLLHHHGRLPERHAAARCIPIH